MTALNKQALREAAEKATPGPWEMEHENIWFRDTEGYTKHLMYAYQGDDVDDQQDYDNTAYIAAFNPKVVLALLDELEKTQAQSSKWCEAFHKAVSVGARYEERIAELEGGAFNPAILDVVAERQRQQSAEGWTPEHDDQYGKSQLLWASSCYMLNTIQPFNHIPMDWPWDSSWWKPTNPRRDLVKAGALIIAEIERIDRAAAAGKGATS